TMSTCARRASRPEAEISAPRPLQKCGCGAFARARAVTQVRLRKNISEIRRWTCIVAAARHLSLYLFLVRGLHCRCAPARPTQLNRIVAEPRWVLHFAGPG